jgi:MFS family permease
MLSESVPKERVGAAFGLLQTMDSAGAIAGPLVALVIVAHYGVRGVFWAAAIPGLLSIAIVAFGARETGTAHPHAAHEKTPKLPLPGHFYFMLAAVTLFSLGNSSDMFLVLRAQETGIAARYAPLLGLVFNVTYTAASWPAGYISDRASRHILAASGYLVFAVVYAVFAAAPSPGALWAMMSFYGLYYALTSPVLRALVVDQVPHAARGRAFGYFYFTTSVATLIASIGTGELWKHFGAELPLAASAALALLAAILLLAGARTSPQ